MSDKKDIHVDKFLAPENKKHVVIVNCKSCKSKIIGANLQEDEKYNVCLKLYCCNCGITETIKINRPKNFEENVVKKY